MRLFFIHGFGELPTIFDKIAPELGGEQVFVNVWDELNKVSVHDTINATTFAQLLIDKYQISAADTVIGHSMGGWIAVHIKEIKGATCIQIASFTDAKRIIAPSHHLGVLRFLLYSGLYFNKFTKWFFVKVRYNKKPSQAIFKEIFFQLASSPKDEVFKQIRILFEPATPLTTQPDLRIHAKADKVVAPPRESYLEVPEDHFTLYTLPYPVLKALRTIIPTTSLS